MTGHRSLSENHFSIEYFSGSGFFGIMTEFLWLGVKRKEIFTDFMLLKQSQFIDRTYDIADFGYLVYYDAM